MDNISVLIGVLAAVAQICGYWAYYREVELGRTDPNGASWGLWGLGTFIALIILDDLTGDWVKDLLPFFCSLSSFVLFILFIYKKRVGRPERLEVLVILLDVSVLMYWYFGGWMNENGEALVPNILLAVDTVLTFIPMIQGLLNKRYAEVSRPWSIWTLAYSLMTLTFVLRLESVYELVYPVTCLILHTIVWKIAQRQTAKS